MRNLKLLWILAVVAIIFLFVAEGTFAWFGSSDQRVGSLEVGYVRTEIVPGSIAQVRNIGNTDAFIRTALVTNWTSEDSVAARPVKASDYLMEVNQSHWFEAGGYWYYRYPVPAGSSTLELVSEFVVLGNAEGSVFDLEVLCSAVQVEPIEDSEPLWLDVIISDGILMPRRGGS